MFVPPRSNAKPYCQCKWSKRVPTSWMQLSICACGEDNDVCEWKWEQPTLSASRSIVVSEDQRQVTFHPYFSSGTAAARGDTPLKPGHHYYWEVKMLSETYGTDIVVGIGTNKVNTQDSEFRFTSLLGEDGESYGLSFRGNVMHNAKVVHDNAGFCRGSIIGVRVDMWHGTLEFYLNREPQGTAVYDLRRHPELYPMISSTAAQSSLRLTYAASWRASLLVDAAKTLAASVREHGRRRLPPGLWNIFKSQFWLTMPSEGCITEDDDQEEQPMKTVQITDSMLTEIMPSQYMNGYYVDSIDRNYRVVVWQ